MRSNKIWMIWLLFVLFVAVCLFKDAVTAGVVGGVFTITVNWLFKIRKDEKNATRQI